MTFAVTHAPARNSLGDQFEGTGTAIPGEHPAAIVTATVGGETETARFELHLESDEAGDGHTHAGQ